MTAIRTKVAAPGGQTITWAREFEASATRVFNAHTDPALLAQWTGPVGNTLEMRELDARPGGCWSYEIRPGNGASWASHGSFHEVTAPSRLVQPFEYDGEPGHPTLEI